ncbi:TonB family protein [Nitrospira sp. CMX1]|nr:TonB family protein [Nitrospira sp.]MBS0167149.1 TonB family protein [Nitrospira sp.]
MQAWTSAGMLSDDEWQAKLARRLSRALFVSLALHVGILALVAWVRLPHHGERPLASIEISLASLPAPQVKTLEPQKSQPISKEKEVERPKPVPQNKSVDSPKPVERTTTIAPPKAAPVAKSAPVPPPSVSPPPVSPPVTRAKSSNDVMSEIMKDIELPPDAPKRGDISPEERPKAPSAMKLPDVPVASDTKDLAGRPVAQKSSSSLTEDLAKDLDEEFKKIKKLEVPKTVASVDVPSKPTPQPAPQIEAKVPSVKAVDTTLKVPGMAPGSNAYLALVRQRISNCWSAPPLDLTSQAYVVVVQFRLHRDGKVTGISIEQSSGNEYYDLAGKRAVLSANPLPVFPADISDSYFDAHFTFTVGEPQG